MIQFHGLTQISPPPQNKVVHTPRVPFYLNWKEDFASSCWSLSSSGDWRIWNPNSVTPLFHLFNLVVSRLEFWILQGLPWTLTFLHLQIISISSSVKRHGSYEANRSQIYRWKGSKEATRYQGFHLFPFASLCLILFFSHLVSFCSSAYVVGLWFFYRYHVSVVFGLWTIVFVFSIIYCKIRSPS